MRSSGLFAGGGVLSGLDFGTYGSKIQTKKSMDPSVIRNSLTSDLSLAHNWLVFLVISRPGLCTTCCLLSYYIYIGSTRFLRFYVIIPAYSSYETPILRYEILLTKYFRSKKHFVLSNSSEAALSSLRHWARPGVYYIVINYYCHGGDWAQFLRPNKFLTPRYSFYKNWGWVRALLVSGPIS